MSTIFRDQLGVGDFTFNTRALIDGAMFNCDLLDGWDDSPEPTVVIGQFTYSDGVSSSDRFPLKEKYIEVGGWVYTTNRLDAERAKARIRAIFRTDRSLSLVRYGPLPVRYEVRASSRVEILTDIGREGFRWLVQVMAEWPFRLGLTEKSAMAGVFTGSGFYRDYPAAVGTARTYAYNATKGIYYRTYKPDLSGNGSLIMEVDGINSAFNPRAVVIGGTATGWNYQAGTGESSVTEYITGATDGPILPDGSRITTYARRNIAVPKTAANNGWFYRSLAGEQFLDQGESFVGSMFLRSSYEATVTLQVLDRLGTVVGGTTNGPATLLPADEWVRLSVADNVTAAAGADGFQIWAVFAATQGNEVGTIEATGAMAEPRKTLVGPYLDGAMSGSTGGTLQYSWEGADNASPSRRLKYTQLIDQDPLPDNVLLENEGDANAYPILEIKGPLSPGTWYVVNDTTGETMTFESSINANQTLVIDTLAQTANIDDVPVDFYIRGSWLMLVPGVNQLRLVSGSEVAGATMTVRIYNTWS